jgi:hypothetical protein
LTRVEYLYIVGAGFSRNAGLPLATEFTQKLLDIAGLRADGPSAILVECMRSFVNDVFGDGRPIRPEDWPQLEDLFTTIDLAANTGHNLGCRYSASDLRTIRRALILRLMRMLRMCYRARQRAPDAAWNFMAEFCRDVAIDRSAFLSMNWDTVIEDRLFEEQGIQEVNYGCSAIPAVFRKSAVQLKGVPAPPKPVEILKPHGSVNWMYCDACSRLYWFPPRDTEKIAARLFKDNDGLVVERLISKRPKPPIAAALCPGCGAQALGTRFATFSYRKALDFPMHYATWIRAEELLHAARTWIFIGYSMPAADYQFKHLLKRVQLSRRVPPEYLVVTKALPGDTTVDNYRRFFGVHALPDANVLTAGMDRQALLSLRKIGALRKSPTRPKDSKIPKKAGLSRTTAK